MVLGVVGRAVRVEQERKTKGMRPEIHREGMEGESQYEGKQRMQGSQ